MCGLAGIVGSGLDKEDAAERVRRMCATIRRRGPDASGVSIGESAVLGHQRLSIVDLSGGAQPMATPSGDVVLVYNGEIFNHESIRRDLPESTTQEELEAVIDELNANPEVTAYIVQLPLPKHLDANAILERIDPRKDGDGLHPVNLGKLVLGVDAPLPATPRGIRPRP